MLFKLKSYFVHCDSLYWNWSNPIHLNASTIHFLQHAVADGLNLDI